MTTAAETVAAALARMTPGEWVIDALMGDCSIVAGHRLVANTGGYQSSAEITAPQNSANAAGIVTLRNLAPDLLAELDAARAEAVRLRAAIDRQAAAVRTLHASEETEINRLRRQQQEWHQAIATLDSERQANALLTAEVERLREALAAIEKGYDAYDMRETAIRALNGGDNEGRD